MKNTIISILFFLPLLFFGQTRNPEGKILDPKIYGTDTSSVCFLPDQPATFPGGIDSMNKFLRRNFLYSWQEDVLGTCYMRFTVEEDGSICDLKLLRGIPGCPECDKEVFRVLSIMPKFNPARKNCKPIKVFYNVPIKIYYK